MSAGYIKLHRVIQDNPAWTSEPFTRSQAWIDMILSASYKPHSVRIRGIKIDLERGQLALSEVEYAKRWKWSRGKVHRFLREIESETVQQIVQQKTNVTSLVTIINYDKYQGDDTANDTTDGQQTGSKRAANGHIQEGKEREEGKEGKEQEGEAASARPRKTFEKPTLEAVLEYVAEINAGIDPQGFIDHYESNGWKVGRNSMKDWKATVRKWKANRGTFGSNGNGNGAQRNGSQAPQAVTKRNAHLIIEEGAAESWK